MARRMLIDATYPEETRVVVLNGNRLEEFDFETSTKKQIKGNIYLAKITRVEPSLQAAFVEYGGNRHGFLAFSEIHPDYYRIPVSDREAMIAAEQAEHDNGYDEEGDDHALPARHADEVPEEPAGDSDADAEATPDSGYEAAQPAADGSAVTAIYAPPHEATTDEPIASESVESESVAEEPVFREPASALAEPAAEPEADEHAPVEHDFGGHDFAGHDFAGSYASGHDFAGHDGSGDEATGHDTTGHEASADDAHGFTEAPPVPLETVGGDELEDVQVRPRVRHYRNYKIQEVIKRRQILLVQVTKESAGPRVPPSPPTCRSPAAIAC